MNTLAQEIFDFAWEKGDAAALFSRMDEVRKTMDKQYYCPRDNREITLEQIARERADCTEAVEILRAIVEAYDEWKAQGKPIFAPTSYGILIGQVDVCLLYFGSVIRQLDKFKEMMEMASGYESIMVEVQSIPPMGIVFY